MVLDSFPLLKDTLLSGGHGLHLQFLGLAIRCLVLGKMPSDHACHGIKKDAYFDKLFPRRKGKSIVTAMAVGPSITIDKFVLLRVPCHILVTAVTAKVALAPFSAQRHDDLPGRTLEASTTKLPALFMVMLFAKGLPFKLKVLAPRKRFQAFHADKVLHKSPPFSFIPLRIIVTCFLYLGVKLQAHGRDTASRYLLSTGRTDRI